MLELNKVLLIGNLTRDPELSYIPSGMAVAKMGIALNRRYKDRNGEQKEEVAFVDLQAWGKSAEFCSQYLKKGRRVFVEGSLRYEKWEGSDGAKRSKLSVNVDRIQFADGPPRSDQPMDANEGQSDFAPPSAPSQVSQPSSSSQPFPSSQRGSVGNSGGMADDSTADDLPF